MEWHKQNKWMEQIARMCEQCSGGVITIESDVNQRLALIYDSHTQFHLQELIH